MLDSFCDLVSLLGETTLQQGPELSWNGLENRHQLWRIGAPVVGPLPLSHVLSLHVTKLLDKLDRACHPRPAFLDDARSPRESVLGPRILEFWMEVTVLLVMLVLRDVPEFSQHLAFPAQRSEVGPHISLAALRTARALATRRARAAALAALALEDALVGDEVLGGDASVGMLADLALVVLALTLALGRDCVWAAAISAHVS